MSPACTSCRVAGADTGTVVGAGIGAGIGVCTGVGSDAEVGTGVGAASGAGVGFTTSTTGSFISVLALLISGGGVTINSITGSGTTVTSERVAV